MKLDCENEKDASGEHYGWSESLNECVLLDIYFGQLASLFEFHVNHDYSDDEGEGDIESFDIVKLTNDQIDIQFTFTEGKKLSRKDFLSVSLKFDSFEKMVSNKVYHKPLKKIRKSSYKEP